MTVKVFGIGNEFRGDDAIGLMVLRALKDDENFRGVQFFEKSGEGTSLMSSWSPQDTVYLIDAFELGGNALGEIICFDAKVNINSLELIKGARCSTHDFGVREAILLSKELGTLPRILKVYGCAAGNFSFSKNLSPGLETSIKNLIELVKTEIVREGSLYA